VFLKLRRLTSIRSIGRAGTVGVHTVEARSLQGRVKESCGSLGMEVWIPAGATVGTIGLRYLRRKGLAPIEPSAYDSSSMIVSAVRAHLWLIAVETPLRCSPYAKPDQCD
jgi:hypothetical protein